MLYRHRPADGSVTHTLHGNARICSVWDYKLQQWWFKVFVTLPVYLFSLLHIQFSVQSSTRQTPESSLLQPPVIQSAEIRTSLSLHDHLQSCTCKLTVLQQIFTLYRTQIQNDLPQLTVYRLIFQQTNMSLSVHDHSNGNNWHNQKSFRLDSAFTEAENVPGFLFFRSSTTWSKCIFKATFKAKCLMKRTSKKRKERNF